MRPLLLALLCSCIMLPVHAASDRDINQLTTYATILGRAAACGLNTEYPSRQVGAWMDRAFSAGDKRIYLPIFMEGMTFNARMQRDGKSPDTCDSLRRTMNSFTWP